MEASRVGPGTTTDSHGEAKERARIVLSKGLPTLEGDHLKAILINSHPDSGYVPRAKLSIADAWYAEGAFKQAVASIFNCACGTPLPGNSQC
jgi:hypothetical protein